jgi:hypothetical protein
MREGQRGAVDGHVGQARGIGGKVAFPEGWGGERQNKSGGPESFREFTQAHRSLPRYCFVDRSFPGMVNFRKVI